MEMLLAIFCANVCVWEIVAAFKSQEKTAQKNCSLLPRDILTAPRNVAVLLHSQQSLLCVCVFCSVYIEFTLPPMCVCVSVRVQCWCWPDGDFLCVEYSPGEGEGRGHPGCLPDSQEPQTAETPHGADTGERPFEPWEITSDYSFGRVPV